MLFLINTTKSLKQHELLMQNIDLISEEEAKKLLEELADKIAAYNHAYYIEDNPLVSDSEYDQLFNTNLKLEQKFPHLVLENSPSKKVGAKITNKFTVVVCCILFVV